MKICNDIKKKEMPAIPGQLYRRREGMYKGHIYIAVDDKSGVVALYDLVSSELWSREGPWGSVGAEGFYNVTDQYCLKRID